MDTHNEIRNLLAAYEQGLLLPEETSRIEEHLYECDECFNEAASFSGAASLLRRSPAVREEIDRLAGLPESAEEKKTEPSSSAGFLKYLLAAAVIVFLAAPIYWFGLRTDNLRTLQTLELLPNRSSEHNIIYFADGGDVRISFYAQSDASDTIDLLISNLNGDTVFFDPGFSDFNEWGMGTIVLPVGMFEEGHFSLLLSFPSDSTDVHEVQYLFRVR